MKKSNLIGGKFYGPWNLHDTNLGLRATNKFSILFPFESNLGDELYIVGSLYNTQIMFLLNGLIVRQSCMNESAARVGI